MQCVKWQRRVLRERQEQEDSRSILESVMNEVMFEIPSDDTISKCIITKEAVDGTGKPVIEYRTEQVNKAQ